MNSLAYLTSLSLCFHIYKYRNIYYPPPHTHTIPAPQTHCLFINKRMPRLFRAPVIFYLKNQGSGCLPASLPGSQRQNGGNAISPGVMGSGLRPHCWFPCLSPVPENPGVPYVALSEGLGRENPGQGRMLWTRWFLPGAGGKFQFCYLSAVGTLGKWLNFSEPQFLHL